MLSEITRQLFDAIHQGNLGLVKTLWGSFNKLEIDAAYESVGSANESEEGNTLLLEALSKEHLEIALFLIENGANLWKRNHYGINALPMLMMVGQNLQSEEKLEPTKEAQLMQILGIILANRDIKANINSKPTQENVPYKTALALAIVSLPSYLLGKILPELKKAGAEYVSKSPVWSKFSWRSDTMERVRIVEQSFPNIFSYEELMRPHIEDGKVENTSLSFLVEDEKQLFEFFNFCAQKLGDENTKSLLNYPALPALQKAVYSNVAVVKHLIEHGADPTIILPDRKLSFEQRIRDLADPNNKNVGPGPRRDNAQQVLEYLETVSQEKKSGLKRK